MSPRSAFPPLLGALVIAAALSGCGDSSDAPDAADAADTTSTTTPEGVLRGMTRTQPTDVSSVSLPDASDDGAPFTFAADDGRLLVVYFGYTSCPDVCPTTLADLRTAFDTLGEDADLVDLAMVTIDPTVDTPEVLTGYVQAFVDDAHALSTTDDDELRAAADAFGADYRVEPGDDGEPIVEHTGFLYVVDDEGSLLLGWPYGQSAADIAHDLALLLEEAATT
jgi:protein SCO1